MSTMATEIPLVSKNDIAEDQVSEAELPSSWRPLRNMVDRYDNLQNRMPLKKRVLMGMKIANDGRTKRSKKMSYSNEGALKGNEAFRRPTRSIGMAPKLTQARASDKKLTDPTRSLANGRAAPKFNDSHANADNMRFTRPNAESLVKLPRIPEPVLPPPCTVTFPKFSRTTEHLYGNSRRFSLQHDPFGKPMSGVQSAHAGFVPASNQMRRADLPKKPAQQPLRIDQKEAHPGVESRQPLSVKPTLGHIPLIREPYNSIQQRNQISSQETRHMVCTTDKNPMPHPESKAVVSKVDDAQEAVKTWLTLPKSDYNINYEVGQATTNNRLYNANGKVDSMLLLQLAIDQTPFERRMQELKHVLETKYAHGTSLVYIREIIEPNDPEFLQTLRKPTVQLQELSNEQVSRLRIIIVDQKRKEVMVPYLGFYQRLPYNASSRVVDHFENFKVTYNKVRDSKVKFNVIFCFTLALHKFNTWMHRPEGGWGRQKMIEGLALRWKNLLKTKTPEQLDLDTEFSFPAVLSLLHSFKIRVENAPTFGDPPMVFKYD